MKKLFLFCLVVVMFCACKNEKTKTELLTGNSWKIQTVKVFSPRDSTWIIADTFFADKCCYEAEYYFDLRGGTDRGFFITYQNENCILPLKETPIIWRFNENQTEILLHREYPKPDDTLKLIELTEHSLIFDQKMEYSYPPPGSYILFRYAFVRF